MACPTSTIATGSCIAISSRRTSCSIHKVRSNSAISVFPPSSTAVSPTPLSELAPTWPRSVFSVKRTQSRVTSGVSASPCWSWLLGSSPSRGTTNLVELLRESWTCFSGSCWSRHHVCQSRTPFHPFWRISLPSA